MLGAGLWGTVLANHLARRGCAVRVWEFFPELARSIQESRRHPHLPHLELEASVRFSSDLAASVSGADTLLSVLPSAHVRATASRLREALGRARPRVVNASKGLEPRTLRTMGEVLEVELPALAGRVYTISGPSFAREVARGVPTALVLAGPAGTAAEGLRRLFDGGPLRVELSNDRKGVELGGALKNVLAIGCGVLDGMKAGANTKAAFFARGLAEMGRLVAACGGRTATVYGLSGLGDLVATGTSPESRNRALGEKLGEGKTTEAALREIPTVTEGVDSAMSARALARKRGVDCPLITAVWRVVHRGEPPSTMLKALGFQEPARALKGAAA